MTMTKTMKPRYEREKAERMFDLFFMNLVCDRETSMLPAEEYVVFVRTALAQVAVQYPKMTTKEAHDLALKCVERFKFKLG